jgi:hypothetical protein
MLVTTTYNILLLFKKLCHVIQTDSFQAIFSTGNKKKKKKSQKNKACEYGGCSNIGICFLAKNHFTTAM